MPSSVSGDSELMKFAIKGTDADWENALTGQDVSSSGVVQIRSNDTGPEKRKLNQDDVDKEAGLTPQKSKKKKKNKKSKK